MCRILIHGYLILDVHRWWVTFTKFVNFAIFQIFLSSQWIFGYEGPTHHPGVRFVHRSGFNSSGQDVGIVLGLKPIHKRLQKLPVSSINMLRIFKCKDLVYFNLLPEFFFKLKKNISQHWQEKLCFWRKPLWTMTCSHCRAVSGLSWGRTFWEWSFFWYFNPSL